jgi:predicted anti-sigma-YlaC factor YlaD
MNSECDNIKEKIADLVSGMLSEPQVQTVEQHLDECAGCREYARALKHEDGLLTEFFTMIDTNMTERQERVVKAINRSYVSEQSDNIAIWRIIMKSRITKLAAAAAIIGAVMLSIHLWDKSTPSAYAFKQTVEAMQGKRSFHIQTYFQQRRNDEFWAEFDEEGKLVRFRQDKKKAKIQIAFSSRHGKTVLRANITHHRGASN